MDFSFSIFYTTFHEMWYKGRGGFAAIFIFHPVKYDGAKIHRFTGPLSFYTVK